MSKYLGGVLHLGEIDLTSTVGGEIVNLTDEQIKLIQEITKKLANNEDIKTVKANIYDHETTSKTSNIILESDINREDGIAYLTCEFKKSYGKHVGDDTYTILIYAQLSIECDIYDYSVSANLINIALDNTVE